MTPPVALTPGLATPGTPSVPGVVGSGAPGTAGGVTPGVEGFGALVAAALAVVPGAPAQAEAVTPVAAGATATADLASGPEPADLVEEAEQPDTEHAAQLLGIVVPVALLSVVPVAVPSATGPTDGAADVVATGAAAAVPAASEATSAEAPSTPEPAPAPTPAAAVPQGTQDQPGWRHGGDSPAARREATSEPSAAPLTSASAPQAVAAPEAAKTATIAASDAPTSTGPVARQTFPEVTRLMSRGDGTHRITLQLRPEGLGEVRVVLTLKEGKVDVRMTSSTDARQALTSDLPELHRLLAAAGATETSVSVRDAQQLVSSSWDGGRSTTASSHDLLGEAGTGQPRHHESPQQAGTSADHIATDGVRDRARASGPNDPATGTRTTGLDVTV